MKERGFNLDSSLEKWIKELRQYEGYEDGQINEIEDHIRSEIIQLSKQGFSEEEAFEKAIDNFGDPQIIDHELSKFKARSNLFFLLPSSLKIAFRKMRRNSLINVLNIFSLSIGLGVFLLIALFIRYEYSFDRFHEKGDRIYRLELDLFQSGRWTKSSTNSYMAGEVVKLNSGVIEKVVQMVKAHGTFSYNNLKFTEKKSGIVSSTFFDVFTAKFIHGNAESAFDDPNNIVLDKNVAKKYFGEENPIGKQLLMENFQKLMTVSGVIEPMPSNAHFFFNVFMSFEGLRMDMHPEVFTNPGWTMCYDYLLIKEGEDIKELEVQFPKLVENHIPNFDNQNLRLRTRPLYDIHFYAQSGEELSVNRDIKQIRILTYIGLAILLLTIFNYLNLNTARYHERIKEVGLRKIFGAEKTGIRAYFLGESLVYTFTAFVLAGIMVLMAFPFFNFMLGTPIQIHFGWLELTSILGLWVILSLLISVHPATVLPAVKISDALSKRLGFGTSAAFRKVLIFFQFSITIALLAGLGIMFKQVTFLQKSDPGFQTEGVFTFVKAGMDESKNESFRNELLKEASIKAIGRSSISMPGPLQSSTFFQADSVPDGPDNVIKAVYVDDHFFEVMDLELASGVHFDQRKGEGQIILNEKAIEKFGWRSPLQKSFSPKSVDWKGQVVGVAKDFNFESLYNEIIPVVFVHDPEKTNWMYVQYEGDIREIFPRVRNLVKQFYPEAEFNPTLIDENVANQYKADQILVKLAGIFTLISIIIAGMGIFGMAFFITQKKTKEIAIRKVIGASLPQIFWFLTRGFVGLFLMATLVASPISYLIGKQWLTNFPYKINLTFELFIWSILFTIILTLLASGIIVIRAALQNPTQSLRYE